MIVEKRKTKESKSLGVVYLTHNELCMIRNWPGSLFKDQNLFLISLFCERLSKCCSYSGISECYKAG